ncbi:MAG: MFS transporter [Firmicutes bacterium HGW-Firmicutes-21]|nr:MAG: MFS transporter [Firmicutes bacterium HGW-Firmicutes-21]
MNQKKTKRLSPVIASIAIQLCLGTAYIWSVFQTGIATHLFGGKNASAALTFSLLLAILSLSSGLGGKLQAKIGPRLTVIIGGIILGAGFFSASFASSDYPWLLWLTYGVMGGLGMGFIYSTTIACAQRWYPDKRGFITGLIVSALGFGGVVFTPLVEFLIKHFGNDTSALGELSSFKVLGIIFVVVCTVGGLFIKNPPVGFAPEGWTPKTNGGVEAKEYLPSQVLRNPYFYFLTIALMLACMGGLMMIGFAKPIAIAKDMSDTAVMGVFAITFFNSFGRLFWGIVSDKLGRKKTIVLLLIATSVLALCVNLVEGYFVYGLIALIGFAYGGFLSTFPAFTADLFGAKNNATNYGMVLLGFGAGAIASSYIAGHFKDVAKNNIDLMFPAFVIASAAALIAIVFILLIKPDKMK